MDSRLRPRCAAHDEFLLVFAVKQNLIGILAVNNRRVIAHRVLSPLRPTHLTRHMEA